MQMKYAAFIILAGTLIPSVTSNADMFTPSHSCFEPSRPFDSSDEWQVQIFLSEVENYRWCIQSFVDEQRQAAKRHLNAAEQAVEEWNYFAATL